jgi:hypothetical protein
MLAEEAVICEPVSAANFPANREKYREFVRFWRPLAIWFGVPHVESMAYVRVPCEWKQGILMLVAGKLMT